jgi:hypothetical protein
MRTRPWNRNCEMRPYLCQSVRDYLMSAESLNTPTLAGIAKEPVKAQDDSGRLRGERPRIDLGDRATADARGGSRKY